ncbi:MAG: hypothetical protein Q9172_000492 [Xanthocarpia lactea]
MLGRKRSQRSSRQPVAKPEKLVATPADQARVVSLSDMPQNSKDCVKNKPRPVDTSYERSGYSQLSAPTLVNDLHISPNSSHPPDMMIGVALGSPGHRPLPLLPPEDSTSRTRKIPELPDRTDFQPNGQERLYPKASRWKTLGGFFGKRSGSVQATSASSTPSPSQLEDRPSPLRVHGNHDQYQSQPFSAQSALETSSASSGPQRDWIGPGQLPPTSDRERRTLQKKPSLRRNHFVRKQAKDVRDPGCSQINQTTGREDGSPKPPPKDGLSTNYIRQVGPKASLLQVDIPSVELERYSVMFSSLLQPCQEPSSSRQPSPKRQPSLLARRQTSLQELHTAPVSDFERPWMRREHSASPRAASPNKSPSFSLFPPSPTASSRKLQTSARERSPLHRSATTPGAISPSRAKFDFSSPSDVSPNKAKFDFSTPAIVSPSEAKISTSTDPTDQFVVIIHTPTEQSKPPQPSRKESFFSSSDAESFITANGSPAPEALSPSQLRNNSPHRPSPARRTASTETRNSSAQRPSPTRNPSSVQDPLREAAEISIARQISISQRQRQLLVQAVAPQPVQPKIVDANARKGHAERKSHHSHHLVLDTA